MVRDCDVECGLVWNNSKKVGSGKMAGGKRVTGSGQNWAEKEKRGEKAGFSLSGDQTRPESGHVSEGSSLTRFGIPAFLTRCREEEATPEQE